jgi:hypothetical protein
MMAKQLLDLLRTRYPNWSEEVLKEHVRVALQDIKEYRRVV